MPFTERTVLSTDYGVIECSYFQSESGSFCLALTRKPYGTPPFVRIHSSCLFSETFHSNDCDCALQLEAARKVVAEQGGVIIYLFQEGRGIGLEGKMQAINIEREKGVDTAKAFHLLGFMPDPRSYDIASEALTALGIGPDIALATNNPLKIKQIESYGFRVVERRALDYETNPEIDNYLLMKQQALDHYEED